MRGASVVQIANGTRWLRAYGSLPHPNLLGGFTLALMAPPLAYLLSRRKLPVAAATVFVCCLVLIVLTFSRSAWLGLAIVTAGLFLLWRRLDRRSLLLIGLTGLATAAILVVALRPLFSIRLGGTQQVKTEFVSDYTRRWLVERTFELIQENPILGTGIGSYPLALSRHVAEVYQIEPVHNLPLLAVSELGILGVIVLGGLVVVIILNALRLRDPAASILSLALLGMAVSSLFDHFFWTLAPGRMLLAVMLGLWAGQVKLSDNPSPGVPRE
jgi:O-antigen ligase